MRSTRAIRGRLDALERVAIPPEEEDCWAGMQCVLREIEELARTGGREDRAIAKDMLRLIKRGHLKISELSPAAIRTLCRLMEEKYPHMKEYLDRQRGWS